MAEMMLFSMDGIVVNDETLSVDVIKEVGPRSDFLAHMNTFENMYIQSKPKRIDRLTRDRWNEAGHLDMETRALIAAKELLATWEPEPLPEEACARVRAVLNAAERATFSEAHGMAPYPISRISTPIPAKMMPIHCRRPGRSLKNTKPSIVLIMGTM